jgi:hypothetical protein
MKLISTYYKEDTNSRARAEVIEENETFVVQYYNANGNLFRTERFVDKPLRYAEDAAENWALNIKLLNE